MLRLVVGNQPLDELFRISIGEHDRTGWLVTDFEQLVDGVSHAAAALEDADQLSLVVGDCEFTERARAPPTITTMSDERMFSTSRPIKPDPV